MWSVCWREWDLRRREGANVIKWKIKASRAFLLRGRKKKIFSTIKTKRVERWRNGLGTCDQIVGGSTPSRGLTEYHQLWASCSHRCRPATKQYNLVPAKAKNRHTRRCSENCYLAQGYRNGDQSRAMWSVLLAKGFILRVFRARSLQLEHIGTKTYRWEHGRPHIGANVVSWPPGKMDEKLKSENMQKSSFLCLR